MTVNRLAFKFLCNITDINSDYSFVSERYNITEEELKRFLALKKLWGPWAKCEQWDFIMTHWKQGPTFLSEDNIWKIYNFVNSWKEGKFGIKALSECIEEHLILDEND